MAKVFLMGNRNVNVSYKKGQDILKWKGDSSIPKDRLLDLGSGKFEELRNVKGVDLEMSEDKNPRDEERRKKIAEDTADWNIYVGECKKEDVETKARRTLKSWCSLLWTARGNRPAMRINEEMKISLMGRLIDYFENNPNEWHAEKEIFQDLIPITEIENKSKVKGFKTIGEMIQTKLI